MTNKRMTDEDWKELASQHKNIEYVGTRDGVPVFAGPGNTMGKTLHTDNLKPPRHKGLAKWWKKYMEDKL